jgi:catalase
VAGLTSVGLDGAADHWNHRQDDDYDSQPGLLFRLMTAAQKQVLFEKTARARDDDQGPVRAESRDRVRACVLFHR